MQGPEATQEIHVEFTPPLGLYLLDLVIHDLRGAVRISSAIERADATALAMFLQGIVEAAEARWVPALGQPSNERRAS